MNIYLETGKTRTIAAAVDWLGWCRSARTEDAAIQALFAYAPRYASALHDSDLHFIPPEDISELVVVERLAGNATTDFGAPDIALQHDSDPVDSPELQRLQAFLQVSWAFFDSTARAASGRELRKGPRGGGRDLASIIRHVRSADESYLSRLGGKWDSSDLSHPDQAAVALRQSIFATLAASARGEIPSQGPRGGRRWSPRFFVRRTAWHALDHAWEIEDKVI